MQGLLVIALSIVTTITQTTQQPDWKRAEREIKRLPPAAFAELPPKIIQQLKEAGCTIPQTYLPGELHNVIHGEFAKRGQKDWAVLCSKKGKSAILVFWGAPTECPAELGWFEDRNYLQIIGDGKIGYSAMISPVGKEYILDRYKEYGGPKPPPVNHQGINSIFVGKASKVFYCYQGNWLKLTGAD